MKTVLGLILLFKLSVANADTLSFDEVWHKVTEVSRAQEGADLKSQSMEAGLARAENHWLPKVYLDLRSYQTNEPGISFFGLLSQRKVESTDFSPDSLNHPDAQIFTRGALGVDLALYEGGMKQAQVEMYTHLVAAEKFEASQIKIEQYVQSSLAYGSIALIYEQRRKLNELNDQLAKLMKGYQLGQKSNPLGYSGLLGMKSLANRIAGLSEQLEAQQKSSYAILNALGVKDANWLPQALDAQTFVDRYLRFHQYDKAADSNKTLAIAAAAKASSQASRMEKARYLPKIGAFAESSVFNGSRDTAGAYTAGLYLQWSLFDPSDYGKFKEANLASLAAEKFSEASAEQESAEREGLSEADKTLRANLVRLDESDKLLSEQTRVSATLFRNGSINALQFVEILNRRTDLISQQMEAKMGLLKNSAERVKKSNFEIPVEVRTGGAK